MTPIKIWIENIMTALRGFYDEDYQFRVWVRGEGPGFDSWEEANCFLFDDCDFEGFLSLNKILTPEQVS
jgi:hypothetical protein